MTRLVADSAWRDDGDVLERRARALVGTSPGVDVERLVRNVLIRRDGVIVAELTPSAMRLPPDTRFEPLDLSHPDGPLVLRERLDLPAHPQAREPKTSAPPQAGNPEARSDGNRTRRSRHTRHSRDDWAAALARYGLPVERRGRHVLVRGFGRVEPPSLHVRLQDAGREFARARTQELLPDLVERARAELRAVPVAVIVLKGRVSVRLHGEEIAAVDRHRVQVQNRTIHASDEVLADVGAWTQLRAISSRSVAAKAKEAPRPTRPRGRASASSAVRRPTATLGGEHRAPVMQIRRAFPDGLDERARARASEASAKLRLERRLVPALSVEVATPAGTLVFPPLRVGSAPLQVDFVFSRSSEKLSAALQLDTTEDPLPLRLLGSPGDDLLGVAWAAALVVYAALTCTPAADAAPSGTRAIGMPSPTAERARRARGRQMTDLSHGSSVRREHPLRAAIAMLEAVAGHVRRLPAGHAASEKARFAAEQVGIELPAGCTWVRPHPRRRHETVVVAWPTALPLW
jgi:hypothetical protein